MPDNQLIINSYISSSLSNGPGKRFTIWFQGCLNDCKDCFNADLKPIDGGKKYSVDDFFKKILNTKYIEGVTYTGGEPFLQAKQLLILTKLLKKNNLSVISYTGFSYNSLLMSHDEGIKELLEYLDILIDGKYDKNYKTNKGLAGSSNQFIHYLSDRYLDIKDKIGCINHDVEINISSNGELFITGFPDMSLFDK